MVLINLYIPEAEQVHELNIQNCKELINFASNKLNINNFVIFLQNGDKINKKKIMKIEKFFSEKNLDLLLLSTDNVSANADDEIKILNSRENNVNKLIEILNSKVKKIKIHNKIFSFLNCYFKNTNERINNKTNKLTIAYENFKINKNELDSTFIDYINNFIMLFKENWYLKNISEDDIEKIKQNIEKAYIEFNKIYKIYEHKLKSFDRILNQFIDRNNSKQKDYIFNDISLDLNKILNIFEDYNRNPKETLLKIEKDNLLSQDKVNTITNLFKNYSSKIKMIIDDDSERLKREVINKIAELNLLKKNLEQNLDICLIPKKLKFEIKEFENEIICRKEFDMTFKAIVSFINNNLLSKEEIRRKEFTERMNHYCKNEMYRSLFNKIYDNYSIKDENILNIKINLIQENLNKIFNCDEINNSVKINQKLLNIQNELDKIIKENLKLKEYNIDLIRNNSDLVFVEKDEIIEIKNETNTNEMINILLNQIKKINEMTKPPENSINLDISNTSLINSIYLSNLIYNEKGNSNYFEIEKFVMQYEDKIYFYDVLYEYINNFIIRTKIKFNDLCREKPQNLGLFIETILRSWINIRKENYNYKNKLKQLIK